jgi:hypothetical protein
MSSKVKNRPLKYKTVEPKRTAIFSKRIATLNAYSSSNSMTQTLMNTVKKQYEDRDITHFTVATSLMDSLNSNNFNEFTKKYSKV